MLIEKGATSYGAYLPDLPECIAVAKTRKGVLNLQKKTVEYHLESLREEGKTIPQPTSETAILEVKYK